MMTKLRESTAIILWIVIVAFVGLIVVQWGADYSGRRSRAARSNELGVINGREISLRQFQQMLRNATRQQQPEDQRAEAQLVRQVWDNLVSEVLLTQEIERLGIEVSDAELAHYTRTQPPSAVQEMKIFQSDGQFDMAKYTRFVDDPSTYADPNNKYFVLQVEQMIRNQLLNLKLQQLLRESVQVSPAEVRQYYAAQHEKVKVEYLFAPASKVEDEVELAPADLQAYYDEHVEDFRRPAQVLLQYVFFETVPTAADSQRVREEIEALKRELDAGADFAKLAESVSEDPGSAANGGELGVFGRGRMVEAFETAAFALKEGEVSAPVQTQFGWHLIKLEERLEEEGEEKVRARHILLKFQPSSTTEEAVRRRAEEFKEAAEARGFAAAAADAALQVRDSGYLPRGVGVRQLGENTRWVVNLFFDSEVGAMTQVVSNERGFWVAQLAQKRPEGVAPLEEVRPTIERQVKNLKKARMSGQRLEEVRRRVREGAGLKAAAAEAGLELRTPDPFARADLVPGLGRDNAFVAAAFRLQPGELSQVVTGLRGAYLIRLIEKIAVDEEQYAQERAKVASELHKQRGTEFVQAWFAQLYESAQIEDNRHLFYTF